MTEQSTPRTNPYGINVMLVSHTNVGKTTMVRTLLGKDIGEVIDAPDVTKAVTSYDLVTDPDHGSLLLWDTPGFGESNRLAQRLQIRHRLIAWIVRELWDRFRNKKLWRNQQIVIDIQKRAHVILYLVNALERPVDATYIDPEIRVLDWIGKPVLAILNQTSFQSADRQQGDGTSEWHDFLAAYPVISKTLNLDSFTRCWVQELILFDEIGRSLREDHEYDRYQMLAQVMCNEHLKRYADSLQAVSKYLTNIACDKVELSTGLFDTLKRLWDDFKRKTPWGNPEEMKPVEKAIEALSQRLAEMTETVTNKLIHINLLTGVSAGEIIDSAGKNVTIDAPVDASTSILGGGVIGGIIMGLGADLMAGGLTLGTGALIGGVLGSLSSGAIAQGYNMNKGKEHTAVTWSHDSLFDAFRNAVMLYLAVAHFGRGQGEWQHKDDPDHWLKLVNEATNRYRSRLVQLWTRTTSDGSIASVQTDCYNTLKSVIDEVLQRLYPESRGHFHSSTHPSLPT